MRDAEATIEKVLAGLRDAEPSPGMERRILAAIDAHQTAQVDPPWGRLLRPAIALLLVCAVFLAIHRPPRPPAVVRMVATPVSDLRTPPAVPTRRAHVRVATAVGQKRAASYPAPPLPLTEQERLLLRLAQRTDAKDTAILNPVVRAEQSAKATAQFQQFFGMNDAEMRSQLE